VVYGLNGRKLCRLLFLCSTARIIKIKEEDILNIEEKLLKNNRPRTALHPVGIVIHSTANVGTTALNHYNYWNNNPSAKSSAHYIVDWNKVLRLIPESEMAWHAGPTANKKYLGLEICETNSKDQFNKVWENATWAVAEILKAHGWNTRDNVFSHNWVSKFYKETDHTDPYPYFNRMGKSWGEFLAGIDREMKPQQKLLFRQHLQLVNDIWAYSPKTLSPVKKFKTGDKITAVGTKTGWYILDIDGVEAWIPSTPCKKI
jgi:N-acetyl-anhydromuramyl-L-alanine amidase AmpD